MPDELEALQTKWLELEQKRLLSQIRLEAHAPCSDEQLAIEETLLAHGGEPQAFHLDKFQFDPIAELADTAPEVRDRMSFIIVGAGVSGLCMAARLRQAGFHNFEILEKAPELGGTWHHNQYPGLACDVPAQYYSFSFFRNPRFSSLFAPAKEIKAYLQAFSDEFGLTERIAFSTRMTSAKWSGESWEVEASDGRARTATFLILANGFLHTPKLPDLPGLGDFAGKAMHSSHLTEDFDLRGLKVGNIGTGSTTVQIAASIVDKVDKLVIFQRTPQWVFPFPNEVYSERRRDLLSRYPGLTAGLYEIFRNRSFRGLGEAVVTPESPVHALTAEACRANLDLVADPELRRKLTPDYAPMCKRLVYSADFYRAVQKPNCELVTESIERIEPDGVRTADGRLHPLDLLILSTGYDITGFRNAHHVESRGRTLAEAWEDGVRSVDSVAVSGFPNMFMLGGAHATVGNFSIMGCAEEQSGHIVRLISAFAEARANAIEPTPEAEDDFVSEMNDNLANTVWVRGGCRSWYLNEKGGVDFWTRSIGEFVERMRAPPNLAKFSVSAAPEASRQEGVADR